MPVAGGGFDQCYNAQALVDTKSMRVLVPDVVQAPNDKRQVVPMLEKVDELPPDLPRPKQLTADTGFCSEANVEACEAEGLHGANDLLRHGVRRADAERALRPGFPFEVRARDFRGGGGNRCAHVGAALLDAGHALRNFPRLVHDELAFEFRHGGFVELSEEKEFGFHG